MAQRHICPSMGALRRSLTADVAATSRCQSRTLHSSARRLEEQPSGVSPSAPAPTTRKARSANALQQITSLQQRRIIPGALARNSFPSGQMARRNPHPQSNGADEFGFIPEDTPSSAQSGTDAPNARFARNVPTSTTIRGSAFPSGQMARAPSNLRISRSATVGSPRSGPNLRGQGGNRNQGPRRGGPNNNARGPKKRDRTKSSDSAPQRTAIADIDPATTLSNGMVHQLLRLQRKDWDRVPYEPKYAQGSFAANELIHAGRELFKGESPPVKIWGSLEKRIGVVGMFGAEAHLKIRREGDGDTEAFGHEDQDFQQSEATKEEAVT